MLTLPYTQSFLHTAAAIGECQVERPINKKGKEKYFTMCAEPFGLRQNRTCNPHNFEQADEGDEARIFEQANEGVE